MPENLDIGKNSGWLGRPICSISRNEEISNSEMLRVEESMWSKPKKIAKMTIILKDEFQTEMHNRFKCLCRHDEDCDDEPDTHVQGSDHVMKCEMCIFGTQNRDCAHTRVKCLGCGVMIDRLFQPIMKVEGKTSHMKSAISSTNHSGRCKQFAEDKRKAERSVRCPTKMRINNVIEEADRKIDDITLKLENLKTIGDQIRDSLDRVRSKDDDNTKNWKRLSLIVDSGASDNAVGPRDMLGY